MAKLTDFLSHYIRIDYVFTGTCIHQLKWDSVLSTPLPSIPHNEFHLRFNYISSAIIYWLHKSIYLFWIIACTVSIIKMPSTWNSTTIIKSTSFQFNLIYLSDLLGAYPIQWLPPIAHFITNFPGSNVVFSRKFLICTNNKNCFCPLTVNQKKAKATKHESSFITRITKKKTTKSQKKLQTILCEHNAKNSGGRARQ